MHACTLRLVLLLFFGGFKRLWQQVKVYITTSEAKKEERVVKVILGWVKANAKTIQDRSDAGCSRRPTKNLPKTFFLQCFPLTHALKWTTDEKKTVREFLPAAKPSKYFFSRRRRWGEASFRYFRLGNKMCRDLCRMYRGNVFHSKTHKNETGKQRKRRPNRA